MPDLPTFRKRVRELCRNSSSPDGRRDLADLARAIGLSRSELSRRMNGSARAKLTSANIHAIVRALVNWGAIGSKAEVNELFALVDCPPLPAAEWATHPFDRLNTMAAAHAHPTAIASSLSVMLRSIPPQAAMRLVHQPETTRGAIGRTAELDALEAALLHQSCVAILGVGGVGKSTLAAMYAAQDTYHTVCWRNLHHNPNFADFTQVVLESLGLAFDPGSLPRPEEQAAHIVGLLRQPAIPSAGLLIVLNNFESVVSQGQAAAGWQDLLTLAAEGLGASRLLLTTRELPASNNAAIHTFALGGLSLADSLNLLANLKVDASAAELEQAVQFAGGHPLALIFLADLIHNQGYSVADLLAEPVWNERIALRLLDKIYQRLSLAAQATLTYLAMFTAPASAATVVGMLAHLPAGFPLPDGSQGWDEATVQHHVAELARRSLAEATGEHYQLHPIVREYAHNHLFAPAIHHHAAAAYFQSRYTHDPESNPPQRLADVQPLLDAFDHFCAADDYEAAYAVFIAGRQQIGGNLSYHISPLLFRWGEYIRAITLCQRLVAAPPDRLAAAKRSVAFNILGIAYRQLGSYAQAITYLERGLELADQQDIRNKLNLLANLAIAYEKLKDYPRAISYNHQVLALAEPAGLVYPQSVVWSNLGNIYLYLGDYEQALAHHLRALQASEQINDPGGGSDLMNVGAAYFKLGQIEQAQEHYRRALDMAEQLSNPNLESSVWQRLGALFQQQGHERAGLVCYLKALPIRERLGNADDLTETLTSITTLREQTPATAWPTLESEATALAADPAWRPWKQ